MTPSAPDPVVAKGSFKYIAIADLLRTMAILLVVLNHIVYFSHLSINHHLVSFAYFGAWGVNCFFVLSGYLLSPPFIQSIATGTKLPSIKLFYLRRFLRIYPLYFTCLILSIIVATLILRQPFTLADVLTHLFLVQGLSPKTVESLNAPMWTMGIDAGFYLLLPLCALGIKKLLSRLSSKARITALTLILVLVCMSSTAFRCLALRAHPMAISDFDASLVFVRNVIGFGSSFTIGILSALFVSRGHLLRKARAVSLIGISIFIVVGEFAGRFATDSHYDKVSLIKHTAVDPLAALSVGFFLISFGSLSSERSQAFITNGIVRTAATLAYAIYLVHWLVLEIIEKFLLHSYGFRSLLTLFILSAVSLVPTAIVLNRFVERPFLTLKEKSREISRS